MKRLLRHILIGLGAAGFILAALTVLLFNRSAFGWQALSVPTGSMRPAMPPGSLVITHRIPLRSLKVGDVITHTNPLTMRTTITHRIVKEFKFKGTIPAFITKGDANPSADPMVVGGLVQGKAVWHVSFVGRVLMWAKTWLGLAVLVYLPALLIMVHETRLLAAYLRKTKPYRLEGWLPEPGVHGLRPGPAIAFGAAVVLIVVGVGFGGWQAASALATQDKSAVLLVLSPNVIAATAQTEPGALRQDQVCATSAGSSDTQVGDSADQTAALGNSTSSETSGNQSTQSGSTYNANATNLSVGSLQSCIPAASPPKK